MIYILTIGIIQIGILAFTLNKKHILNPSCIACAVFLISASFAIYSKETWGYQLHFITIIVILSSLLIFTIGSLLGTKISCSYIRSQHVFYKVETPSLVKILLLTSILIFFAVLHYKSIIGIAAQLGADMSNIGDILKKSREGLLHGNYTITRVDAYSTYFCRAIAYVCIYIFFLNKLVYKNSGIKNSYLLLPCIPLIIKMILSTGRTQFIYLAVYILTIFGILFFQTRGITVKTLIKIVFAGLIILLSFFSIFALLQIVREADTRNIIDVISYYTGMSIPSLDNYLVVGREESNLIGNNTLFPIYDVLRKLGFDLPELYAPYDFLYFNGTKGNVYTAFRRYIEDYTIIGNYIILLILGTISSFSYNYVFRQRGKHFALIIYAMFIYPVFELSIEERVFMTLVGTSTIYNLIALAIAYIMLVRKPLKFENNSKIVINHKKLIRY